MADFAILSYFVFTDKRSSEINAIDETNDTDESNGIGTDEPVKSSKKIQLFGCREIGTTKLVLLSCVMFTLMYIARGRFKKGNIFSVIFPCIAYMLHDGEGEGEGKPNSGDRSGGVGGDDVVSIASPIVDDAYSVESSGSSDSLGNTSLIASNILK